MRDFPAVFVRIPTSLRVYTTGAVVAVNGETVAGALDALGQRHPGILEKVLDDRGELQQFISIYLGGSDIRSLNGLATRLEMDDILAIIPAGGGGKPWPGAPG